MSKKPIILFMILLLVLGCDQEESESTNISDDTAEEMDTTPPIPTISGLEVDLEVATTINISIQETSDIEEISVLVNQNEILSTIEKTFSFELNPFDYPNGENTLTIISLDSEGNQGQQTQTFEVNKLLVSIAAPFVGSSQQAFFSVNTMDGTLVSFALVSQSLEIIKLYADDSFTPQPIVVTSYVLDPEATQKATLYSISNIETGTDLVAFQEAGGIRTENTNNPGPNVNNLSIDITEIETTLVANSLFAVGHDHLAQAFNTIEQSNGFNTQVRYTASNETIDNTIIYTSNVISPLMDIPFGSENYKYLFLENPLNFTTSFSEFKASVMTNTISIPSNTDNISMRLFGFVDESAFANNEYHFYYDLNDENLSNSITMPSINELAIKRNELKLRLDDGRRLEAHTLGIKDIQSVPDWTAILSGGTLSMSGDFDKFTWSLFLGVDPNATLQWSYTAKAQETYSMPFDVFEFPPEFINYAMVQNLNLQDFNANGNFSVEQFDSSEPLEYEELLFSIFTYTYLGDVYILFKDL